MLTDQQIADAQPRERPYKLGDSGGLYVFVTPAGGKSFRFKYRLNGAELRLTFGLYPGTGLAEARKLRDDARRSLSLGVDPRLGRAFTENATVAQLSALARESGQPSRVYFVRRSDGLIKIGVARDVFARMSAIQKVEGPLSLIGSMPGSYAVEQALHQLLEVDRVQGEWFRSSQRLLDLIEDQIDRSGG